MHRITSVFYTGFERASKANDIVITLTLVNPLNFVQAWRAYLQLIQQEPGASAKWFLASAQKRHQWTQFSADEREQLLAREKELQHQFHSQETIYSHYDPTLASLPIRVRPINQTTVVILINHVFSDGDGSKAWLDKWCDYYLRAANINNAVVVASESTDVNQAVNPAINQATISKWNQIARPHIKFQLYWNALKHFYSLIQAAKKGVADASRGRLPDAQKTHSIIFQHIFTPIQTQAIKTAAQGANLSSAAYLTQTIVETFFAEFPQHSRVQFGIATNARQFFPQTEPLYPGSLINPFIANIDKAAHITPQLHRAYTLAKSNLALGLLGITALLAANDRLFERYVFSATLKSVPKRAAPERLSFIHSHVRELQEPHTKQVVKTLTAHTKSQTIFILTTAIHGQLSIEWCATEMLYDANQIKSLFTQVVGRLIAHAQPKNN